MARRARPSLGMSRDNRTALRAAANTTEWSTPMSQPGTISLERPAPKIATITFSNPPVNLVAGETVTRLHELVAELGGDPGIQVVVFKSGVPDFFLNHFDLAAAADFPVPEGNDAVPIWTDVVLRLTRRPTSRSRPSAAAPAAAATSSPWPAICATRAGRRRCSASPRSAAGCCPGAAGRSGCPGSPAATGHWRSS